MQGYIVVKDSNNAHLGGNISEGDPFTYCPSVWNYVINRFGIKSVLDLGSGLGYSSQYFHCQGLTTIAVDGLIENVKNSIYPTIFHDIIKGPIICKVDLVHCHEVVEHIDAAYLDNLLNSLLCGKYILITHALPGQGGYHHVNEQPPEYWIDHMARKNCHLLTVDSERIRQLAGKDGSVFMERTGMIFSNRNLF